MPTLPEKVKPGDIITSEFMNSLLDEVEFIRTTLDGLLGALPGTVIVPSVFGKTLIEARSIVTSSENKLALGSVFNIYGVLVDPLATEVRTSRVLYQLPVAGARVAIGSSVNMVISAAAGDTGTGPGTPVEPIIDQLLLSDGTPSTSFSVGTGMIIIGSNFDPVSNNNSVTIGGVVSQVTPSADDPTHKLRVTVPAGIPGAPTEPGQSPLSNVPIIVLNTITGLQATRTCTIDPPPAVPPPQILSIPAGPHLVGSSVVITGSGFSSTLSENVVRFDVVQTETPGSISLDGTQLTVTVPAGIPGLNVIGDVRTVDVSLVVNGVPAVATFPTEVEL
ncbi:MAG: hypothetical protein OEZ39_14575 [Gammaproteobacteria bacterium]|nr:hypothetical protein [Gammaproteobacteria bacterium]MDH5653078.1 hypothetical protein [Gammaproteobacteria bacterium]